jgi:hypothetical protein
MAGSVYAHHKADTWQRWAGLGWHRLHRRRDVLSTALALDYNALLAFWSLEHGDQDRRIKDESHPQPIARGIWWISTHNGGMDSRISGVSRPIIYA